jgi:SWI/SNF-related matrix-associated actin-dependent regulator of chromatin subfamily A-like protein 1
MDSKVLLFQVTPGAARWKNIPLYFVATILAETNKAYFLHGHGTLETAKKGICCQCGRELTHPVSVELGIGPECGKHYWNWDAVGGYTKENIARLMKTVREGIVIDCWMPKGLIVSQEPSTDVVEVPSTHPMIKVHADVVTDKPARTATMAENEHGDRVVKIKFPYNDQDLNNVRGLSGRRFHADDKCWSAPISVDTVEALQSWGFMLDARLEVFLQKVTAKAAPAATLTVPGLRGKLFPFQERGVAFIESRDGRAIIADEMGLGKTVQALAWLQLHPEHRPAVVVVPASLKLNWDREAVSWLPAPKTQILRGTTPYKLTGEIIIINYDILSSWVDELKAYKPSVLIMDEIHYIKSNSAQRTKATKLLAKGIPYRIGLSGTIILNRPVEAFNAGRLIDPNGVFNKFWDYAHRYCNARNNGFGWDFSGASNTQELHDKLTDPITGCMIRRKKSDVLTDLPDKIHSFIPVELDNENEYRKAEADFIGWVRANKGEAAAARASNAETLAAIEVLKQLAVQGKLKQAIDWITNFLDEGDGKLVVFAVHKFVIDALMNAFGTKVAVKIDGSTPMADRQRAVDIFQHNPECRLFIGNIKAAGVGLTLTAASTVAFFELPWTPGDLSQAEDRCHRIGQKDSVNIHYLLATNTIEEQIARLLDKKRKVLDSVLDGEETAVDSLLGELMKMYLNNAA